MREKREVLRRLIALVCYIDRTALENEVIQGKMYSLNVRETQRRTILSWLEKVDYFRYLTELEQQHFLQKISLSPDKNIISNIGSIYSVESLLWALGLRKKLEFTLLDFSGDYHEGLSIGRNYNELNVLNRLTLRSKQEIKYKLEQAIVINWRTLTKLGAIDTNIKNFLVDNLYISRENPFIVYDKTSRSDVILLEKDIDSLSKVQRNMLNTKSSYYQIALEWIISNLSWDEISADS